MISLPALLLLFSSRAAAHPMAHDEALLSEIARATSSLKMDGYPPPYFVALRVSESTRTHLAYDYGRPAVEAASIENVLTTEVRVGSPQMDNHAMGARQDDGGVNVALESGGFAWAHEAWRTIDQAYKQAAANFLQRQAQRVERGKADYETDDLAPEPVHLHDEPEAPAWTPDAAFRAGMAKVSSVFRSFPELLGSVTQVDAKSAHAHLMNSEGSRVAFSSTEAWLEVSAETIGRDGMEIDARRRWYARSPEGFPSWDEAAAETRRMAEELRELAQASSTAPFSAPALLDPSATAGLMAATAARLEGEGERNPEESQTYGKKLGTKVLPAFMSLKDDPTTSEFRGRALAGSYRFDQEGVPSRPVTLIDRGELRSFLLSRYPVLGLIEASNGHGRAEPGKLAQARPGNLFVLSDKTESLAQLKLDLRQACKRRGQPAGVWVRRILSWSQQSGAGEHQAFRGVPEEVILIDAESGRETRVRGLDLVGTPLALLGRILAAGDDPAAVNLQDSQASGVLPVGVVAPTLLVEELELQRSEGKALRPPVLEPPKP